MLTHHLQSYTKMIYNTQSTAESFSVSLVDWILDTCPQGYTDLQICRARRIAWILSNSQTQFVAT